MRGARGGGRWAVASGCASVALSTLLALRPSPLAAQHPGSYTEHAVTTVAVASVGVETRRTIVRDGRYEVSRRGDTVVVRAVELALRSTAGEETVRHDTDGFVGGSWKLLAAAGGWRVVATPFVPAGLEEVVDLAGLMDEFFPPPPPSDTLPVGLTVTDPAGRTWQRLPGDGVHAVHAWRLDRESDTTRVVGEATTVEVRERVAERGEGAWTAAGPVSWSRQVVTTNVSTVAGRVIRAQVDEAVRVTTVP